MRLLIAALGLYGVYRFLLRRPRRGPRALLPDLRERPRRPRRVRQVVYRLVEHDGGWAYKVGDVFSESYPTRQEAVRAAEQAAAAHRSEGSDTLIEYQDRYGRWHEEVESGDSRPETRVEPAAHGRQAQEERANGTEQPRT